MKFGTIIADPPWDYSMASKSASQRGYVRYRDELRDKYPVLRIADLEQLPVGHLAARNSVLMLWCTKGHLADGLNLIDTWGFTYKTFGIWGKTTSVGLVHNGGVGFWFRGADEIVLIGSKGRPINFGAGYRTKEPSLYLSPKLGHSAKPDWMHRYAEKHCPGPYLELFATQKREGWEVLGNQAPGDGGDIRDSIKRLLIRE